MPHFLRCSRKTVLTFMFSSIHVGLLWSMLTLTTVDDKIWGLWGLCIGKSGDLTLLTAQPPVVLVCHLDRMIEPLWLGAEVMNVLFISTHAFALHLTLSGRLTPNRQSRSDRSCPPDSGLSTANRLQQGRTCTAADANTDNVDLQMWSDSPPADFGLNNTRTPRPPFSCPRLSGT